MCLSVYVWCVCVVYVFECVCVVCLSVYVWCMCLSVYVWCMCLSVYECSFLHKYECICVCTRKKSTTGTQSHKSGKTVA